MSHHSKFYLSSTLLPSSEKSPRLKNWFFTQFFTERSPATKLSREYLFISYTFLCNIQLTCREFFRLTNAQHWKFSLSQCSRSLLQIRCNVPTCPWYGFKRFPSLRLYVEHSSCTLFSDIELIERLFCFLCSFSCVHFLEQLFVFIWFKPLIPFSGEQIMKTIGQVLDVSCGEMVYKVEPTVYHVVRVVPFTSNLLIDPALKVANTPFLLAFRFIPVNATETDDQFKSHQFYYSWLYLVLPRAALNSARCYEYKYCYLTAS